MQNDFMTEVRTLPRNFAPLRGAVADGCAGHAKAAGACARSETARAFARVVRSILALCGSQEGSEAKEQ